MLNQKIHSPNMPESSDCSESQTQNDTGDNQTSQHIEPDHIHATPTTLLNNLRTFKNLWIVSFAYCNPLPANMTALSAFACLGFVDVSYTRINWKTLQESLRKTQVLRLHCFECPLLEMASKNMPAAKQRQQTRGFALFVLPHVWVLNGIYVCCIERKKWRKYFTMDAGGVYSELVRKWKLEESRVFMPSRLKTGITMYGRHFQPFDPNAYDRLTLLAHGDAFVEDQTEWEERSDIRDRFESRQGCDSDEIDSNSDQGTGATPRVWTAYAREWLNDYPVSFTMEVDLDIWRLRRLACAFEGYIGSEIAGGQYATAIEHSISSFLYPKFDDVHLEVSAESRSLLILVLFGSLFHVIPTQLLQSTLSTLFDDRKSRTVHWTMPQISPLVWNIKDRITYLGLLVGRALVDTASPVAASNGSAILSERLLQSLSHIISLLVHAIYPVPPTSETLNVSNPKGSTFGVGFDYDNAIVADSIASSLAFTAQLTVADECETALLLLNLIQLMAVVEQEHLIVFYWHNVFTLMTQCIQRVAPDATTLLKPVLCLGQMAEVASRSQQSESKSSATQQQARQARQVPQPDTRLSVAAEATQLKLQMIVAIEAVLHHTDDTKADDKQTDSLSETWMSAARGKADARIDGDLQSSGHNAAKARSRQRHHPQRNGASLAQQHAMQQADLRDNPELLTMRTYPMDGRAHRSLLELDGKSLIK